MDNQLEEDQSVEPEESYLQVNDGDPLAEENQRKVTAVFGEQSTLPTRSETKNSELQTSNAMNQTTSQPNSGLLNGTELKQTF